MSNNPGRKLQRSAFLSAVPYLGARQEAILNVLRGKLSDDVKAGNLPAEVLERYDFERLTNRKELVKAIIAGGLR